MLVSRPQRTTHRLIEIIRARVLGAGARRRYDRLVYSGVLATKLLPSDVVVIVVSLHRCTVCLHLKYYYFELSPQARLLPYYYLCRLKLN